MKKPSISKRTLKEHPQYFGVFANMARHNVYLILYEIADRTGLPKPPGEESLHKSSVIRILDNTVPDKDLKAGKINRPDKCKHVIQLLNDHFRFLPLLNKSLDAQNQDPRNYHEMMCLFLHQLDETRNQYTHAINKKGAFNADLIEKLEFIFDARLPDIKTKFKIEEKEMSHLRRWKEGGKGANQIMKNPEFKYFFYNYNDITENGLAFFLCLFLEPEYSYLFLSRLNDFKKKDIKVFKATLEAYIISRSKLPERKLVSSGDNRTAFLLDMLNELQRCPKALFDRLSPDDKAIFETGTLMDEEETPNNDDEEKALLIRKQNRFPYFALRYIDLTEMFQNLRFQVDLGNYQFHSYDNVMDNQSILRRWEKKLLSFGRLHEIDEKAKAAWKELIRDPSSINDATHAPFILQTQAHYHFDGGDEKNIGLKDISQNSFTELPELKSGKDAHIKTQEPDFYLCTDELPGLLLYNFLVNKYKGRNAESLIISFKERIQSFLNDFATGKITPVEKQKITNQYSAAAIAKKSDIKNFEKEYKERKEELAKELLKYGLEPHQVPESLCKYLMGIEPVHINERAEQVVRFHIEETQKLLERAGGPGSRKDKKSKKLLRKLERSMHISAGDSALFLAKDMLFLQPPVKDDAGNATSKGKANPDEFQLLQARLAYFGLERENLGRTFRLCRLTDSENPHPFLKKINWMKCSESLEFYKRYLEERKSFFENLLSKKNFADYYFLIGNEKAREHEYFISLANEIKKKPANLPRGLFKGALGDLLRQHGDERIKSLFTGGNDKHNIIFLVNEIYKLDNDSNENPFQPFYDYERNYRTVDEWYSPLYENRPQNSKEPIKPLYRSAGQLSQLAEQIKKSRRNRKKRNKDDQDVLFYTVFKKKVIENEKLIRHYRASDQVLFMMCQDLLIKEDDKIKDSFKGTFLLKDISPDNPKSILETRITFSLPVETDSRSVKHVEEEFKIKNYGKLRRYLKDRRFGKLLEYYNESKIRLSKLKEQLKDYEKYRIQLFDEAHEFERACAKHKGFAQIISEKMNEIRKGGDKPKNYVEHSVLLKRYTELYNPNIKEIEILKVLRNAFSHNQFPPKNDVSGFVKTDGIVLKELMEIAIPVYETCIKNLKTGS